MNNKRTRIKIKKSKVNIYNKRKNKIGQTMTLVVTIALACILAVVGYGIGKPIMKYFADKNNSSDNSGGSSQSIPQENSSEISNSSDNSGASSDISEPVKDNKTPGMYLLPIDAVQSAETLKSALTQAKNLGYSQVAVTLKDDTGALLYQSGIDRIKNKTEINTGALTAQQIYSAIAESGMTAAVRISTLKDRLAPYHFASYTLEDGIIWLDNTAQAGGKPWLNPFESAAADYIGELVGELSAAGFRKIICADVIFPPFAGYDKDTWLKHMDLRNEQNRSEALWSVLDSAAAAAAENDAAVWVEIQGGSLFDDDRLSTTAEISYNAEKFSQLPLVVVYTPDSTASDIPADALAFAEKLNAKVSAEIVIMINGSLENDTLESVKEVLAEYDVIVRA